MAWHATRPFTLYGVKYQAGDHIPDDKLPTGVRQSLLQYRRIEEGPSRTPATQASDVPSLLDAFKKIGKGWYQGPDGTKYHGKKAALAAIGG